MKKMFLGFDQTLYINDVGINVALLQETELDPMNNC